MIKKFMEDGNVLDAFITGAAGTGKTTKLKEVCEWLLTTNYNFQVVAYTHKAKQVLKSKLPEDTPISTLHSFLKKRPGINENAKHIKAIMTSNQHGKPEPLDLLIIDEYSFVGEKDDQSLCELQDEENLKYYSCSHANCNRPDTVYEELPTSCERCGNPLIENKNKQLKILYVGDTNQLPPIGAPSNLVAKGPYWDKLTKVHRTDNDILIALSNLVDFIEGTKKPFYLEETTHFKRKQDIKSLYIDNMDSNKILLAYTNRRVQQLNFEIQGSDTPLLNDYLYISSLRCIVKFINNTSNFTSVYTPVGEITPITKYNPLKYLKTLKNIEFYNIEIIASYNDDLRVGRKITIATIFGTYNNKLIRDKLGKALVLANKKSVDSKKIYREYKTINDYVCVSDFNHCMTIHKSQGSEYNHVYLDSEDLKSCIDIVTRLKLLYVGVSRAKEIVYLNN